MSEHYEVCAKCGKRIPGEHPHRVTLCPSCEARCRSDADSDFDPALSDTGRGLIIAIIGAAVLAVFLCCAFVTFAVVRLFSLDEVAVQEKPPVRAEAAAQAEAPMKAVVPARNQATVPAHKRSLRQVQVAKTDSRTLPKKPFDPTTSMYNREFTPNKHRAGSGLVSAHSGPQAMKYVWKPDAEFGCCFSFKAKVSGTLHDYNGLVRYRTTSIDPELWSAEEEPLPKRDGTGTGFVVHPDGVIATCAHVVDGASEIQVHIGKESVPANVIALDLASDVALLHIAKRNLHPLPLADSDQTLLAQPIRVLGYPLSEVLGESLKVSRGEISGIVEQHRNRMFQIDATVNPGNSGAPVVDERGNVVGMASALLSGEGISEIGFAVPSNEVFRQLERNKIVARTATKGKTLSGPDIVKHLSPAVVLLKVKLGRGSGSERCVVEYSGHFSQPRQTGQTTAKSSESTTKFGTGKLVIDSYGRVASRSGNLALPLLLGPLGGIGLDELSPVGHRTWERQRLMVIPRMKKSFRLTFPTSRHALRPVPRSHLYRYGRPYPYGRSQDPRDPRRDPYRSSLDRFRRPSQPGLPQREEVEEVTWIPAVEQVSYELGEIRGHQITIRKTSRLATIHDKGEPTYVELAGSGVIVFDTEHGIPCKIESTSTLKINADSGMVLIPITEESRIENAEKFAKSQAESRQKFAEALARRLEKSKTTQKNSAKKASAATDAENKREIEITPKTDARSVQVNLSKGLGLFDPATGEEQGKSAGPLKKNARSAVVNPSRGLDLFDPN